MTDLGWAEIDHPDTIGTGRSSMPAYRVLWAGLGWEVVDAEAVVGVARPITPDGTGPGGGDPYTAVPRFRVSVPGLEDVDVTCAVMEPSGTEKGTVIIFSGGDGDGWWSVESAGPEAFIDDELAAYGYRVIQVKWDSGWFDTEHAFGPDVMAARPATLVAVLHDLYCQDVDNLVITGHSGGATQCAYVLTHYGLHEIVRRVAFTAGPPHAALAKVCGGVAGYGEITGRNKIDRAYGFAGDGTGPCALNLTTDGWPARWLAAAPDTGVAERYWPNTEVFFLWGDGDTTGAPNAGADMKAALLAAGTPGDSQTIAGMGHGNQPSAPGLVPLAYRLRGEPYHRQVVQGAVTGTQLVRAFTTTPNEDSLLVCTVRASVTEQNVVTPAGWRRDFAVNFDGTTKSLVVFSRRAGKADSGITIDLLSSSTTHIDLYEVLGIPGAIVDRVSSVTGTAGAGGTITIPATTATTVPVEWAIVAVAVDATSDMGTWTDGFVEQTSGARMQSATRTLRESETLEPTVVSASATDYAAVVVAYRRP